MNPAVLKFAGVVVASGTAIYISKEHNETIREAINKMFKDPENNWTFTSTRHAKAGKDRDKKDEDKKDEDKKPNKMKEWFSFGSTIEITKTGTTTKVVRNDMN